MSEFVSDTWPAVKIDSVCELIVDCVNRTAPVVDYVTDYRMIRTSNVKGGNIDLSDVKFVTREVYERWTRRAPPRVGDVVLTREAPLGEAGMIKEDGLFLGQRLVMYRTDKTKLDNRFLLYLLLTEPMRQQISALGSGSTVEHMRVPDSKNLYVPLPPLPVQREIAHILGTLDDKIDLNRKMNATLEAMARALFKSWFVDFDPVRAKAEGRDPAGMDAETAALFPDAFEDSPLGEIPRGWRVAPIGDVVRAVGGSTPSTAVAEYWDGGTINWATPKDMSRLSSPVLLNTERQITKAGLSQISSGLVPRGTVLLSSRAPVGYLAISETPVAINQGFIAMVCDESFPSLYALLWAETNLDVIKNRASGTTFLEISKRNFRPILALVPPLEVLNSFVDVAQPMYRRIVENLKETKTLAEMRDALLPRLMRGELVGV